MRKSCSAFIWRDFDNTVNRRLCIFCNLRHNSCGSEILFKTRRPSGCISSRRLPLEFHPSPPHPTSSSPLSPYPFLPPLPISTQHLPYPCPPQPTPSPSLPASPPHCYPFSSWLYHHPPYLSPPYPPYINPLPTFSPSLSLSTQYNIWSSKLWSFWQQEG